MIFLKIFLGILWFIFGFLYCLLCCIHIKQKVLRGLLVVFLGISVLLSYFVFPKIVFLILVGIGVLSYIIWECYDAYISNHNFKANSFIKHFCSWIFVREEDTLISIVFPKFLTYFVVLILSASKKFRPLLSGIGSGIDVDIDSNDKTVNIHI